MQTYVLTKFAKLQHVSFIMDFVYEYRYIHQPNYSAVITKYFIRNYICSTSTHTIRIFRFKYEGQYLIQNLSRESNK